MSGFNFTLTLNQMHSNLLRMLFFIIIIGVQILVKWIHVVVTLGLSLCDVKSVM